MTYKYTRDEIVKKIKNCPMTEDGYYYCKNFSLWNKTKGLKTDEKKFTFDRECFNQKFVFSTSDIEVYIDYEPSYYNIHKMRLKDKYINSIIKDCVKNKLKLYDYIEENITFSELIDMSIYYFNYKYN